MGGDDYYGERTHQHNRDWEDKSEYRPCYKRSDNSLRPLTPITQGSTYGTGALGHQHLHQQAGAEASPRSPMGRSGHGQWGRSGYGGSLQYYKQRMNAAFEFYSKLGVKWYTVSESMKIIFLE